MVSGVISADPLGLLPVGASIPIEPVVLGSSDASVAPDYVKNWDFFQGALLAVGVRESESLRILGTGVMVAPALAISATHVLIDDLPALERGDASALCIGVRTGTLDLWKLRCVSYTHTCDIAYVSLELMSPVADDWRFTTIPMTTRWPTTGEQLTIVGFAFPEPPSVSGTGVVASGNLFAAAGEVEKVYFPMRDKAVMPYPTIQIGCGSRHGMSGGAVLDRNGMLLGVISTGWDDAGRPANAAWVIGALDRQLDLPWPPGASEDRVELMAIPEQLLHIAGRDAITVTGSSQIGYRVWFDA